MYMVGFQYVPIYINHIQYFHKCDQIRSFLRTWYIYWRNSQWKTSFLVQWMLKLQQQVNIINATFQQKVLEKNFSTSCNSRSFPNFLWICKRHFFCQIFVFFSDTKCRCVLRNFQKHLPWNFYAEMVHGF